MATKKVSKSAPRDAYKENAPDVGAGISLAQAYICAVKGVLDMAIAHGESLPNDACSAANLLAGRAREIIGQFEEDTVLNEPEFVNLLEGAQHIICFGLDNDLGTDNPRSGLDMASVWIVKRALERAEELLHEFETSLSERMVSAA